MARAVNVKFKLDPDDKKSMERDCSVTADPFYSDSNIHYLEGIMQDVRDGKAHFAEHELIEVD